MRLRSPSMSPLTLERDAGGESSLGLELVAKRCERGPARVGAVDVVLVGLDVQVAAADRAETGAVWRAEDLLREREHERVARPGAEVEALVREVRRLQLLVALRVGRLILRQVEVLDDLGVSEAAVAGPEERAGELQAEDLPSGCL